MAPRSRTVARVLAIAVLLPAVAGCASTAPSRSATAPLVERGVASFYHDRLQGRTTASGEPYDRNAMTAAHRSLPFGTEVVVRNLENGRSVRLRINDRGPFVEGRIIDVSRRAANELGFVEKGLAEVSVEVDD